MSNQKKSNNESEIIGNGIIFVCKVGFHYIKFTCRGIKKIYQSKLLSKKDRILFSSWLALQGLLTTQILFSDKWKLTLIAIPLWIGNLLLPNLLFKECKSLEDDFIPFYIEVFKENNYPCLVSVKGNKYTFNSNGNKLDKFTNNIELLEHLTGMEVKNITRKLSNVTIEFKDNTCKRLYIQEEINKPVFDYNSIPMEDGLQWNYRKFPNALVTGIIGGGKTYILFYLIRQLLKRNAEIFVIDPKISDLSALDTIMDSSKCVCENQDIIKLLSKYSKDMNDRYREIKNREDFKAGKDFADYGYNPKFLIFDELFAFFGGSASSDEKKQVRNCLVDVIAKGRQAGFFAILATQRADTKILDGNIRDQLGLRISMGKLSQDGYKMTFGSTGLSRDYSQKGSGFIFIDGQMSAIEEYTSPFIDKDYNFFDDFQDLYKPGIQTKKDLISFEEMKKLKQVGKKP